MSLLTNQADAGVGPDNATLGTKQDSLAEQLEGEMFKWPEQSKTVR